MGNTRELTRGGVGLLYCILSIQSQLLFKPNIFVTIIYMDGSITESPVASWDKTKYLDDRLLGDSYFESPTKESKYGKYKGRDIIGRDSKINGGVYLGQYEREAIAVDDETQPLLIDACNELVKKRKVRRQVYKNEFDTDILNEVYALTKKLIPTDGEKVNMKLDGYSPDTIITLESFIIIKAGVCRHQALLSGYLMERLINGGYIKGRVSVDRNYMPGKGGHAWVRYVDPVGRVYVIDSALNYVGEVNRYSKGPWLYQRPEEKRGDTLRI